MSAATLDDVRQELEDLAAWRSGLSDAVDTILGVSSPRLSTDGRGSSNGLALPFHLDRAVDEPDLGGAGVLGWPGCSDGRTERRRVGWAADISPVLSIIFNKRTPAAPTPRVAFSYPGGSNE